MNKAFLSNAFIMFNLYHCLKLLNYFFKKRLAIDGSIFNKTKLFKTKETKSPQNAYLEWKLCLVL